MAQKYSRRQVLTAASGVAGGAVTSALLPPLAEAQTTSAPATRPGGSPFLLCLNTSTIRGSNLGIVEIVEIAAKAGYDAIEPWISELEAYEAKGGSAKDLAARIADRGLSMESSIGFATWIIDDDAQRAKGLEQMKRDMDLVARVGGKRIAAPAVGAQDPQNPLIDLFVAAERYRAVLEIGDQIGVVPEVEVWGFSKNLRRLGEAALVAIASGHPKACILADVYHLHKGGSDPAGLRLLSGQSMHVLHMNDYPADPPRETITDAHRVYPGDGAAPLDFILQTLHANGYRGALSLELFNKEYWKLSPLKVARTGIEKMRAAVKKALG